LSKVFLSLHNIASFQTPFRVASAPTEEQNVHINGAKTI